MIGSRTPLRLLALMAASVALLYWGLQKPEVPPQAESEASATVESRSPESKVGEVSKSPGIAETREADPPIPTRAKLLPPTEIRLALDVQGVIEPPDPVEVGPYALTLTLLDRRTGRPYIGTIELWRISAPANSKWDTGDQRLERARLDDKAKGRVRFGRLADGLYRVFLWDVESGSEDPAAFQIAGSDVDTRALIDMPLKAWAEIDVVRSDGVAPQRVEIAERPVGGVVQTMHPKWVVARQPRDGEPRMLGSSVRGVSSRGFYKPFERGVSGFRFGEVWSSSRRLPNRLELKIRSGTWLTQFQVEGAELQRPDIVFVLADQKAVLQSIFLPSGGNVEDEEDGDLVIKGEPGFGVGGILASQAVVTVEYYLPHYEPLEFEWRPSGGPPPPRILKRDSQ